MFSDALDREAAWLNTTGDGLPELIGQPTDPFQIVQARLPRVPDMSKRAIYVLRHPGGSAKVQRFAGPRSMLTTRFLLKVVWRMRNGQGSAEREQLAFDQAIDQLLARIEGPLSDKTHGGRFLSVAENPDYIDVDVQDVEQSIAEGIFRAHITYSGDDTDFAN